MKLLSVYSDNLYSFAELELDFSKYERGTTIILGKNLNMDSSNGAGKTTILKIIFYALWGVDIDKVPASDIVNDANPKKGFLTQIKFSDERNIYTITRFNSYKNPKSKVKLKNGDTPKNTAIEFCINNDAFYMPKDNKKVESMIKGTLGMSSDIFLNSVLTAQKRSDNFLKAPDADKKELLSEILDLSQYDDASKLILSDIKEIKDKISFKEQKEKELENFINKMHLDLKEIKDKSNNYNKEIKDKVLIIKDKINIQNKELNELKNKKVKIIEPKELEIEIKNLEDKISKNNNLLTDLPKINDLYNKNNLLLNNTQNKIETIKSDLEKLLTSQKDLSLNKTSSSSIKSKIDNINTEIIKIENEIANYKKISLTIEEIQKELNSLDIDLTKNKELYNKNTNDLKSKSSELDTLNKDNSCASCERPFLDTEDSSKLKSSLENSISSIKKLLKELEENNANISNKKDKLSQKLQSLKETVKIKDELQSKREELVLNKINEENILKKNQEIKETLSKITEELTNKNAELKKHQEDIVKIEKNTEKYNTLLKQLNQLDIKNKEINNQLSKKKEELFSIEKSNIQSKNLKDKIKSIETTISENNDAINELENKSNPYIELILKQSKELKEYEENYRKITNEITALNKQYSLLKFWEVGFSKNGIKSFIIDEIINLLNLKIKENLQILSEGSVSLFFEPEKKIKTKKTTKNEISTKIYINGKLRNSKATSGGEEDRLTLAVDLALSDIAETRSGTKFNIKFLDEPFKWIDGKGQLKALALFNKLSQHKSGFFLISHDEKMQSFCDNAIYVIKENGQSRLVDKKTFMEINK